MRLRPRRGAPAALPALASAAAVAAAAAAAAVAVVVVVAVAAAAAIVVPNPHAYRPNSKVTDNQLGDLLIRATVDHILTTATPSCTSCSFANQPHYSSTLYYIYSILES